MARTVTDQFAQVLAAAGVKQIYGIVSDSLNGLADSLRRQGTSEWIMAQSIGAQVAFPGRQVVSLSGDGGFAMPMGDFPTLAQQRLPVKVVDFNNGALGFIELEQKKASGFILVQTNPWR